ncbi:uncharacterized protein LOC144624151 [Crassostrea virginica]
MIEGERRETTYAEDLGSYLFFFSHRGKKFCIDATFSKRFGRFINDAARIDPACNAEMATLFVNKKPALALFARRFIPAGEEIRYDYGVPDLHWRCQGNAEDIPASSNNQDTFKLKDCKVVLQRLPSSAFTSKTGDSVEQLKEVAADMEEAEAGMEEAVAGTEEDVADLEEVVADMEEDEAGTEEDEAGTEEAVADMEEVVAGMEEAVAGKEEAVAGMEKDIADLEEAFADMEEDEPGTEEDEADLEEAVTDTAESVAVKEEAVAGMEEDVADLEEAVADMEEDEAGTEEEEGGMEEAVAGMGEAVAYLEEAETDRKEAVAGTEEAVAGTKEAVAGMEEAFADMEEDEFGMEEAVAGSEEAVAGTEEAVVGTEEAVVGTEELVAGTEEAVTDLEEAVPGTEEAMTGTEEAVADWEEALAGMEEAVAGTEEAVADLEEAVADMEEDDLVQGNNISTEENTEEKTDASKWKRPERPCPFCEKVSTRLTEHLKAKHKDEERVKYALSLPKKQKNREFNLLKKEGIFKANQSILKSENFDNTQLIRERNQGQSTSLKMCSKCKGFFDSSLMFKHKKGCKDADDSEDIPQSIPVRSLIQNTQFPESYTVQILESFRDTEYAQVIRNDDWIKNYGYSLYKNIDGSSKMVEKRISLNSKLRRLAILFLHFKKIAEGKGITNIHSCSQMFDREYLYLMQEAIVEMTTDKDSQSAKNGLKLSLKYLVQDVCSKMHTYYLVKKEDEKAEEINKFLYVLKGDWPSFFKNAEEAVLIKRQAELRVPLRLPTIENVNKLTQFSRQILQDASIVVNDNTSFCKIRDALVCRLTLYNARRGGETCRMKLSELSDAMTDKWLDRSVAETIKDEQERKRFDETKIAYIQASKLARLIPVQIPIDCWNALRIVSDIEVRAAAGVHPKNPFAFPNTKHSLGHVIGWDSMAKVCQQAGLEENINANDMRHFVATKFSQLDASPAVRDIFFKHMGHSETINENVYQCPPAVREIVHVGKILGQIERGEAMQVTPIPSQSSHVAENIEKDSENHALQQKSLNCSGILNLSESTAANIDMDSLEEFINLVADISVMELLDQQKLVGEEEVNVVPSILKKHSKLVLDKNIQECARHFFTDDAWMAVENTLKMLKLEKRQELEEMEEECSGPSSSKRARQRNEEIIAFPLYESSEEDMASSCSSDIELPDRKDELIEEMLSLKGTSEPKKMGKRYRWTPEEDKAIELYFKEEIGDVSESGNKGKLQIYNKSVDFLRKHPSVLKGIDDQREKIRLIRIKVFNLRRKTRSTYQKNLHKVMSQS